MPDRAPGQVALVEVIVEGGPFDGRHLMVPFGYRYYAVPPAGPPVGSRDAVPLLGPSAAYAYYERDGTNLIFHAATPPI